MAPSLRALALGTLVLITTASCSTGQVNSVWSDTSRPAAPYRSLVVFGLTSSTKVRQAMEDNFASALESRGVDTHPSHHLIQNSSLRYMTRVRRAIRMSGAKGVVVSHLIAEEAASSAPPPRLSAIPDHYSSLKDYFKRTYRAVCAPDYYAGYRTLRLESNLYDAESEKLVWSGRSRQLDPESEETTIGEVIATLVSQMAADGFLPASTKSGGQFAE
ncbi:hypothetical protein [Thiorhodococcus fuscus]|uniref:DUF4136 domain-containing protein n=1 Tax=Thiorhodococcus fuscus TaxID=527200 RepID=A0ABW4Y794_9GAMM